MSRKNPKNIEKKKGEDAMKKLGIGFATALLFVVMTVFPFSFAFAGDMGAMVVRGSLYENGFMNEVLTRSNPSPWNVVRHYVGNHPKLIVKILKEQNISLNSAMKYPVGMAVRIPQKYVLKSLLPTPSQAEVAIKDAEHQAELQKQENEFFTALKSKDSWLVTSYGFIVLLVLALFAAIMAARSWHTKYIAAASTANVREKEFERAKNEKAEFVHQVAVLKRSYAELLAQTPGNYRNVREQSGKEHICLVVSARWMAESKVTEVSIACPYCSFDKVAVCQSDEGMRGHIARNHPERMNPVPKGRGIRIEM